jgi:hypothetical protein
MAGIGIALGAAMISGIVFAAWTVTGGGTASGKALDSGDISALRVVAQVNPAADLVPGSTGTAHFTVENDNAFKVSITALKFDFADPANKTDKAGCAASNLTGVNADGTVTLSAPIVVGAKTSGGPYDSGNKAFKLDANAPTACQGATFTIKVASVTATTAGE